MKKQNIFFILFTTSNLATASPKIGDICHVEADYFYGGVWEEYNQDELVCNYWKFFSEEQQIKLENSDIDDDYFDDLTIP